ncbi:MAG: hypothetical protein WB424_02410 [Terracidiphilus sp.]
MTAIGAGAAVASTGYSIYNGQKQDAIQKTALMNQNTAQQKAEASSLSTERQGAVAENAANQQTPNIAAILARAQQMGNSGLSSTMLTGPGGVTGALPLGKNTLLGS